MHHIKILPTGIDVDMQPTNMHGNGEIYIKGDIFLYFFLNIVV
jgi:hypothetical protein